MIYIESDPTGETYRRVLELIWAHSSAFTLVLEQPGLSPSNEAREWTARLATDLLTTEHVNSWPGTQMPADADPVTLGRYRLTPVTKELILEQHSLFSWCLPALPEDLAFYRSDGRVTLGTTAHEGFAMVAMGEISEEQFKSIAPDVRYRYSPGEWRR
ncbi:MAG: hypothetical protein AAGF92_19280 [Myxococcota bacterium]